MLMLLYLTVRVFMNGETAEEMLQALGEVLDEQQEKTDLLVCGGMALVLQNMSERPTRDIDAMGQVVERNGDLELHKPVLSRSLRDAIERVGILYGRGRNWLNTAAILLHDETALPEGMVERAEVREYGGCLVIRLCSRQDMVSLKMWAAVGRSGPDIEDLKEMGVTEEEVLEGYKWCVAQGADDEALRVIIEEVGHGGLAERPG
jgi:Nucleotidyltransferase of unknown function (DUF6036)